MKHAILLALLLACGTAQATEDALLKAVAFALTADDATPVWADNRANCVFRLENMGATRNGTYIYYLNNIDPTRTAIAPYATFHEGRAISESLHVDLFGERTIREYRFPAFKIGEMAMHASRGEETKVTLELDTREHERVARAWKYIYSHGCKGHKSSF